MSMTEQEPSAETNSSNFIQAENPCVFPGEDNINSSEDVKRHGLREVPSWPGVSRVPSDQSTEDDTGVVPEVDKTKSGTQSENPYVCGGSQSSLPSPIQKAVRNIMVAQESAYQNQVQELHRLVRQQKEIFSQLPGGSMLDVDLNAMPVADSLGEPPVTPKFHLASKRGRELTIIPEASLLFQRPSTPNYPPGFTPNSSNLPLRRALSDCHVAQRPMLTRIPPVAPTQVPDFPQFPPPPVYPSSSPWPSQAQFPSNPYLPPSPAPQVVPWQPNPLWYHQMMPSPAGYNPPPIQPSFQPSFGASPMWPQSHPSAYSERPILSSSFPPSALEPPPPPPPRPAFRQPPPMVLVREKGSRTLKLVSAEEHYGDGRTAGPTSTSPSAAGQSTVSPIIRRRQGEHLQAQLTSGVSDERESLREDRGDVIDPVVIDLPHRPITMPHELQAAAPVRPLARRPDSSAGGQIQEKALQRVLEQLELPQGRGRS